MKRKFAKWELTQLLPFENPYKSTELCEQQDWYLDEEETNRFIHLGEAPNNDYTFLRNAWSWEDIRLYLLSKGLAYTIHISERKKDLLHVEFVFHVNGVEYGTYEEARIEAIKQCLSMIKENGTNVGNSLNEANSV